MNDTQQLPKPEDVSVDYLIKPTPPSHELRFRIKTLLIAMATVALALALFRIAYVW